MENNLTNLGSTIAKAGAAALASVSVVPTIDFSAYTSIEDTIKSITSSLPNASLLATKQFEFMNDDILGGSYCPRM